MGPWASLLNIFFIYNWYRRPQLTVGDDNPGQVVLSCIQKQSKPWRSTMQESPMDSASVPASRFLTWVSAMTSLNGLNGLWPGLCKSNKPFLSKLLLVTMFYHSSTNPMQHAYTHFRLVTPDPLPQITPLFFQINTPYILGSSQAFLLKSIMFHFKRLRK